MIGFDYHISNRRAVEELGWTPRPAKETVRDTTEYMIENQLV